MIKKSISCVAMLICMVTQAQVLYNNGATFIIDAGATLQVNGNVLNNAGTFSNNGTLAIAGSITNNTINTISGTGALHLNGTIAQTINGSAALMANNVVINNAAGVMLSTPLRIDGAATFTNGLITAANSSYPVVFTPNSTVNSVPTSTSHINGYVVKEGTGAFTYPVGDASAYQPISINLSANSGGMMVQYVPGNAGTAPYGTGGTESTPLVQYNTNEYWNLSPVGTATGTVTVYYDNYRASVISSTSDLRVAHRYGGQWLNEGSAGGVNGTLAGGFIISNVLNTWSPFTFGAITPVILPVQWLSVSGTLNAMKAASLAWSVAEANVLRYEVQKSTDARNFTTIGNVTTKGNGSNTYAFAEGTPLNGTSWYRVRQIDVDGRASFSAIIKLSATGSDAGIAIYPNPVKDRTQISIPNSLLNTEANLYNAAGQKLQTLQLKSNAFTLNLSQYKAGTYLLLFSNGSTTKVIKQ